MTYSSSEHLYEFVMNNDHIDSRLKESFKCIKVACNAIEEEVKKASLKGVVYKKNPIFVTSVGNKCVNLFGGPSAASIIQNRKSEPLKSTYINLRATEIKLPNKSQQSFDPIDNIQDSSLKSYIKSLETKSKFLEARVLELSKFIKNTHSQPIESVLANFTLETSHQITDRVNIFNSPISKKTKSTLKKILDSHHLVAFNLILHSGYIIDQTTGLEFLTKEDVTELEKLISF